MLIALMEDWDEAFDAFGAAATLKQYPEPATPRSEVRSLPERAVVGASRSEGPTT